jgi:hypothetical protein
MINLAREAWRPLFLREPVAQRGWSLVTRGVRAYLLRVAEDDGTLLKRCGDPFELARSLGVHGEEEELVKAAILTLLTDGFLRWARAPGAPGWLGIDRLVTFGPSEAKEDGSPAPTVETALPAPVDAESKQARRRRLGRERKRRFDARYPDSVTSVTGRVTSSVTERYPDCVTERTSPPTPPSPGEKNTKKDRTEERDAHARSVTDSVTGNAPDASNARNAGALLPLRVTRSREQKRLAAQAEHERFAKTHELDLEAIALQCNQDPSFQALGEAEQQQALANALMVAAAAREPQEQAS